MAERYEQFRDDLLVGLTKAAETARTSINPRHVMEQAGFSAPLGWTFEAVRELEGQDYLRASYASSPRGSDYGVEVLRVTPAGYDRAEEIEAERSGEAPPSAVPASDRVVRLDHNSAGYKEARSALEQAIDNFRGNNEFANSEPDEHSQRVAELESGMRLLEAVQARVDAIIEVLFPVLRWLAQKFTDHLIGRLATAALAALAALLGLPL
jgi:hypothetical protein